LELGSGILHFILTSEVGLRKRLLVNGLTIQLTII